MPDSTSLSDGDAASAIGSVGSFDIASDVESVESSDHAADIYPFEEYEKELDSHLQSMAFMEKEHMYYYDLGFFGNKSFWPDDVDDLYANNIYCMSWFYDGVYEFETLDDAHDKWWAEEVLEHRLVTE